MIVLKYFSSAFGLGGLLFLALLIFDDTPILIESLESKTIEDTPVYNEISYFSSNQRDIWMMNQSHNGLTAKKQNWDRLAIVVDKNKNPKEIKFYQLPPGELNWDDSLVKQKINYKVSCYMCHSNGPRAIRPNYNGLEVSLKSKIKIFTWNLRIKSYGILIENSEQMIEDKKLITPFRHRLLADNTELQVKSCTKCHNGKSQWIFRNKLTRQNNISIKFMLEKKLMPPFGFSISEEDKLALNKFIHGF